MLEADGRCLPVPWCAVDVTDSGIRLVLMSSDSLPIYLDCRRLGNCRKPRRILDVLDEWDSRFEERICVVLCRGDDWPVALPEILRASCRRVHIVGGSDVRTLMQCWRALQAEYCLRGRLMIHHAAFSGKCDGCKVCPQGIVERVAEVLYERLAVLHAGLPDAHGFKLCSIHAVTLNERPECGDEVPF